MIERFAVMGNPIAHSLSPDIHQAFAQQTGKWLTYEKILGEENSFVRQVSAFFSKGGKGMNITLPFKEYAYRMAVNSSQRATQAKAANTLWMQANQLHADNTDGVGLINDLQRHVPLAGHRVVIIGAGGAARSILGALQEENIASLTVANRSLQRLDALPADLRKILLTDLNAEFDVVINATSAHFSDQALSIPDALWQNKPFCYDLSYHLLQPTAFISEAFAHQCPASDGLGMLVEQAAESFLLWHGIKPDTASVLAMLNQRRTFQLPLGY